MRTGERTLTKVVLPVGLLLLALLGVILLLLAANPAAAPLTPDSQASDPVKVLPTQVAALPVSVSQVVPFSDAVLGRDLLLDASKAGPWTEPSNPVDIRDYPAWRQRFPNLGLSGYAV